MSFTFARTDHSLLGRWWWTVDRWTLAAVVLIAAIGVVLIQAASPAVAERIGLTTFHFIERHLMLLLPALGVMVGVSLLSPRGVLRLSVGLFLLSLIGIALTLVVGVEIKGATRWLHLPGLSVQPSEFVKPAFAVVAAWLFALQRNREGFPGIPVVAGLFLVTVAMLLMQPDLGQTFVITAVFAGQFFLAGLPVLLVVGLVVLGISGLVGAYFLFPHVQSRIDRFLDPASGDNYQVARAMEAFEKGGLWGTGPGQGSVKMSIPDAHADFIFAVAGEELGLLWCLLIVGLFAFVVLRGFARAFNDQSLFVLLAASGLCMQFGLQSLINMGSSLHLMPTKGMTLPFISYGGSSLIALGIGMGMLLALTRRRFGPGDVP
ncbi:FtsW/RodA/SpoVE family cell cycle protein [Rhodospirillum centenum]|uniref:Probable peptidoglycan glycosyltransferase FtsW n=1 Tax=Rhodospirillum centenum (strain ATCC 51521 / SW) TaxID=414684 RepID=B6IRG3_RHOCS|nr:putative peptidoglycan glycosyltransferase FtsW [Rhodospirillum centenum]ACI98049.1 cell division protein FtsW, putative [Rhodospirillum centenum SW]